MTKEEKQAKKLAKNEAKTEKKEAKAEKANAKYKAKAEKKHAPAPASFTSGSYSPSAVSTTPTVTKITSIRAAVSLVRLIKS